MEPVLNEIDTLQASSSLTLPHPSDASRTVVWTGKDFDLGNKRVKVLGYDVAPSGWTDDLTHLHEEAGGSDHFIDVASRGYAMDEVIRSLPNRPATILEIGVSSGFLLQEIKARLPAHLVVGSDYTRGTLEALAKRVSNVPLIQFDLTRCPLPDNFADVIVLLNVLEHIEDHRSAIAQLFRIVRPGGAIIIEVPAGSRLYDIYDRVLMHFRRYDIRDLVALVENAGFTVERRSHLGFLLYPMFYLSKRVNQIRYGQHKGRDEAAVVSAMIAGTKKSSSLMQGVMRLEQALRSRTYLPRGIRCLLTARKPA
jgi:SAM-dependent methyltransferase